jgi:DNA-binding NarL/FixJ family response regulator
MTAAITLLILDGHQGVRNALARQLGRRDGVRRVVATATLGAALRMGRLLAPDLVICDPKTVDGDIACVVSQLCALGCPVLVLAASLEPEERVLLRQAGAAGALLKGISRPALSAEIELALTTHRGRYGDMHRQPALFL